MVFYMYLHIVTHGYYRGCIYVHIGIILVHCWIPHLDSPLVPPDEVDAVSPENSPPMDRDREYSVEEALFLKKNFESLEKSEGSFLNVPNPRLSISAKFLERNMRQVKQVATSVTVSLEGEKLTSFCIHTDNLHVCNTNTSTVWYTNNFSIVHNIIPA